MEFLSTWQFWLGFTVGWILGFILAVIMAASGKASRMEERIEEELASRPIVWNVKNHFSKSETEIATQGKPEDD